MQVCRDKFQPEVGANVPAVDNLHITAGDIALSFNDAETYTVIRDAGIRAGTLFEEERIRNTYDPQSSFSSFFPLMKYPGTLPPLF